MATRARSMIQDQDLNVHFNVAPILGKTDVSKAQKNMGLGRRKALNDISNSERSATIGGKPNVSNSQKGGFGGRKALNDISNSERASSALKISNKLQSENVISVGKGPQAGGGGGRKALSDLTNTTKPNLPLQGVSKKSQFKKMSVLEEVVSDDIFEEGFLHNHDRCCIEDQFRTVGWSQFSEILGLDKGCNNSMMLSPPRAAVSPQLEKMKVACSPLLAEYDDECEWSSKLAGKGGGGGGLYSFASSPCLSPYTMQFGTPNFRLKD